jgi:hypothetical protein
MFDALLFAWRDSCRTIRGFMDASLCEIVGDPEGRPPARCGDWFLAIHQGNYRSVMKNALDEYYGVLLTLTMRVTVPVDRIGDQLLAKKLASQPFPGSTSKFPAASFNQRANMLRAVFHQNWVVIAAANDYLVKLLPDVEEVHGFSEPAQFMGGEVPTLVGSEWLGDEPPTETDEDVPMALKATLTFDECRRGPQPIGVYS